MTTARQFSTVADAMAIAPVVVRSSASLTDAARLMDQHRISGLPVVDAAGSLVGVLSQTDLRPRPGHGVPVVQLAWPGRPPPDVASRRDRPPSRCHWPSPSRRWSGSGIHRLIVVDDRDETLPIGVLSLTDVVHAIAVGVAEATDA